MEQLPANQESQLPARQLTYNPRSIKLISCIPKLELAAEKAEAKLELIGIVSEMMPGGRPDYPAVRHYPSIAQLVQDLGRAKVHKLVFLLIRDFCASINVVRNMNDDQMIELADQMIRECGTFRLEDYAMMFAQAKRGDIGKIFDHLDIQVVSVMICDYDARSGKAGQLERDGDFYATEGLGPSIRAADGTTPQDRLMDRVGGLGEALTILKTNYLEFREDTKPLESEK